MQALFNLPAGDWAGGERGIGCLPDRIEEFRASVDDRHPLRPGARLPEDQLPRRHRARPASTPTTLEATLVANLKYAAPRLADAGIKLLLEPINLRDMPGFFVSTTDHAERLLDAVGSDNLYIQYDIYHTQVMQGDLIPTYARLTRPHRPRPDRRQPRPQRARHGRDQLRLRPARARPPRLRRLRRLRVQAEGRDTTAGLGWMAPYR